MQVPIPTIDMYLLFQQLLICFVYLCAEIILKIEEWRNRRLGEEKRIQQQINNPPKNKKEGETTVRLQFSVAVEQLNSHQKQLLNDFLNSL